MTTAELIKELQKADPTGNLPVCMENEDILCVYGSPAYFDGCLQQLVRDESNPYYNIIGAQIIASGDKINIKTHSIEWALLDNPELPIELVGMSEDGEKRDQARIDKWRQEAKEIKEELMGE